MVVLGGGYRFWCSWVAAVNDGGVRWGWGVGRAIQKLIKNNDNIIFDNLVATKQSLFWSYVTRIR